MSLLLKLEHFLSCFIVSTVDFDQVNTSWECIWCILDCFRNKVIFPLYLGLHKLGLTLAIVFFIYFIDSIPLMAYCRI